MQLRPNVVDIFASFSSVDLNFGLSGRPYKWRFFLVLGPNVSDPIDHAGNVVHAQHLRAWSQPFGLCQVVKNRWGCTAYNGATPGFTDRIHHHKRGPQPPLMIRSQP